MSKLLVPLPKIFLRKISGNSMELHTEDLSEILVLQNLSENISQNLSQNDFRKVNRIEPQQNYLPEELLSLARRQKKKEKKKHGGRKRGLRGARKK